MTQYFAPSALDFSAPLWPSSVTGWLVWFVLLGFLVWLGWILRRYNSTRERHYLIMLAALAVLIAPVSLIYIRLPGLALTLPGVPQESFGPALAFFAALPWVLAGGMFGPLAGGLLGALAGFANLFVDIHSIFTPLVMATMGVLFSAAVRQRYRTRAFSLLRQPIFAALLLLLIYAPFSVLDAYFIASGSVAVRLDYALSSVGVLTLAMAGELLVAGVIAQVLAAFFPKRWGHSQVLEPSPAERSLQTRFLFGAASMVVLLLLALLIVNWIVAGQAARQLLNDRLKGAAETAAGSAPFFLETGQNLAVQLAADSGLLSENPAEIAHLLSERILVVPYFDQLILLDAKTSLIVSYPAGGESELALSPQESAGAQIALNGVAIQIYTIPPKLQGEPARISFVAAVQQNGVTSRILIGRTDLTTNPLSQPIIATLNGFDTMGGEGLLLDDNGQVIYASRLASGVGRFDLRGEQAAFYDDTAPDGTRQLVYYQPVPGRSWAVMVSVPAQTSQQLALSIAMPLTLMILGLAVVAIAALYFGLRVVTVSLKNLTNEAVYISEGHLDRPLPVSGVDEVGQLRHSFEQMRASLHLRISEMNRLLVVSQGVASSLEMDDAVEPVLDAIQSTGAVSVRVVLKHADDDADQAPTIFSVGSLRNKYASLDGRIMELVHKHEILVLSNTARTRGIGLDLNLPLPVSLLAIALRHENQFYGVLWAAYDQHRPFNDPDVRYFSTLAGHAALAAANARLFKTAEVGRRRLEAILASTPDPVLVTDSENHLLLSNPAAWQVLGAQVGKGEGTPIQEIIEQKALLDILDAASPDKLSAEITLTSGQTYLAIASPVVAEGRLVGRVCVLSDVTHFKELDLMKSEFVSTVSHDLRSPLTLMRGYATMLEMVGELNEQQKNYTQKIIVGVESMTRLVNNLLDLGRIEAGVGLQLEKVTVAEIIDRITNALQAGAEAKSIELVLENTIPTSLSVEADLALLHQAIYNLVENAIKYTPNGGRVNVRVLIVQQDLLQVEVKDTGIGIPPADLPRLFEKFYRSAQREARQQKGTGLGLAIVQSIAERHGGKVWVESELGKGSMFILQVPLQQRRA